VNTTQSFPQGVPLSSVIVVLIVLAISLTVSSQVQAQSAPANGPGTIAGTILDPNGSTVANAIVVIKDASGSDVRTTTTDAHGRFSVDGLAAAKYSVEASAQGFALTSRTVQLSADKSEDISIPLQVADLVQAVVVEAVATDSIAAQAAPMDGLLDARSARTEVTAPFIQNYTAPQSDFSELVQMVPGTFSVNSNGVGLGDSKTFFRGFKDGQYDITYDGIPFNDTNDPTHHSWVFFPSPWISGVDFDRSPGSASTVARHHSGARSTYCPKSWRLAREYASAPLSDRSIPSSTTSPMNQASSASDRRRNRASCWTCITCHLMVTRLSIFSGAMGLR
jgi:hypothetical protein